MEWKLQTVSDLMPLAEDVLGRLGQIETGAAVLALHGDLGAGKTTFTQTLAKSLGVTESITSPTFVIMKGYELLEQNWDTLIHIDAYRIEDIDEMRPLGFDALLADRGNIICIEWAENISELLPENTLHLYFMMDGENRTVKDEN